MAPRPSRQGDHAAQAEPGADAQLLQRVMTPVHQRAAPSGVLHVALRLLGLVALDVAVDPLHVLDVVVCVVRLVLALYLDDLTPRLVPLGFAATIPLPHGLRLLRPQPVLELSGGHVDRFVELLDYPLPVVGHDLTSSIPC